MRDRFTRVLKGHIALARALFPEGTRGSQLDTLARQYLWHAGLDYAHGTGHGVGAFLAVHEGPQRIAPAGSSQAGGDEPLQAGMFLSNEPGYYKTGEYGIRIENLVLVVEQEVAGAEKKMLGFETLTFAPIDRYAGRSVAALSRRSATGSTPITPRSWRWSGRSSTARCGLARGAVRAALARPLDGGARRCGALLPSRACALRRRRFSRSASASRFPCFVLRPALAPASPLSP